MAIVGLKVYCLAFTGTAVSPWDTEDKVIQGKAQAGKTVSEAGVQIKEEEGSCAWLWR